jgi:hypothetical protein
MNHCRILLQSLFYLKILNLTHRDTRFRISSRSISSRKRSSLLKHLQVCQELGQKRRQGSQREVPPKAIWRYTSRGSCFPAQRLMIVANMSKYAEKLARPYSVRRQHHCDKATRFHHLNGLRIWIGL